MKEFENNNNLRFVVTQGEISLFEKIIDANQFSLHTRSYIDIRKILPSSINYLQKNLSKSSYFTKISVDSDKYNSDGTSSKGKYYNLYGEYVKDINSFPIDMRKELEYNPESVSFNVKVNTPLGVESMTIKGVECKLALYRNNTPIVERLFYVDRFNPISRWSIDLTNSCECIVDDIYNIIKKSDVQYLWSEYDKLSDPKDLLVIE